MARCLVWLGGVVTDYHAPLLAQPYDPGAVDIRALLRVLPSALPPFDVFWLEKQPETIGAAQNPFIVEGCEPQRKDAHAALLGNDVAAYIEHHTSPRGRSRLRRSEKKLRAMGRLSFVIAAEGPQREHVTQTMIRQKSRRYIETGGPDLFADGKYREFYAALSRAAPMDSLAVHVSALFLDDRIIATHWGLCDGARFYYIMPTFERGDVERYSPGTLLLLELITWCHRRGIRIFDFTIGDDAYKEAWCDRVLRLYRYVHPVTACGAAVAAGDRVERFVRGHKSLRALVGTLRRTVRRAARHVFRGGGHGGGLAPVH
jgi:CelD/BcsL family acetyltransferase involved in cellulose biosynthesis